jgi:hypothetical protein
MIHAGKRQNNQKDVQVSNNLFFCWRCASSASLKFCSLNEKIE